MNTGQTLIVAAIALAAGGFAGFRLAQPKMDATQTPAAVNPEKLAKIGSSAARLAHRRAAPEAQYGGLMTIY